MVYSNCQCSSAFCWSLNFELDLLFILFRIALWSPAGKELFSWLFTCVVFIFSNVLVIRVPFSFGVWDRVWNSIVSVPGYCLFIYFGGLIATD